MEAQGGLRGLVVAMAAAVAAPGGGVAKTRRRRRRLFAAMAAAAGVPIGGSKFKKKKQRRRRMGLFAALVASVAAPRRCAVEAEGGGRGLFAALVASVAPPQEPTPAQGLRAAIELRGEVGQGRRRSCGGLSCADSPACLAPDPDPPNPHSTRSQVERQRISCLQGAAAAPRQVSGAP